MKKVLILSFIIFTTLNLYSQCDIVLLINNQTDATCFGLSDGTVQVSATTSNLPVSFLSNGVTNSSGLFINYNAGIHNVIATDDLGCKDTISFTIGEPSEIMVSFSSTEVSCKGGNDGSAIANSTGGTAPYSFNWSNNQSGNTATGLIAGTYFVTVTDANGCSTVDDVEIIEPNELLSVSFSVSAITCYGNTDGSIIATVQGGTPSINGYAYNWNTGKSSPLITALSAGSYTVTVTDARGCITTETATVGEPSPILNIASSISTTCPNGDDGQAIISSSGGTPNSDGSYQYSWNNVPSSTTSTVTNLTGGQTYFVTITDANGCFSYDSVVVAQPQEIDNTILIENVSCNGFADGSIDLATNGGTPPFQYQWDAKVVNSNNNQALDLALGNYAVTITDFNGCEATTTANITEPVPLDALVFTEDIICKGESTGSISALVAGGTPWYSFNWDDDLNANDTSIVSNVAAGIYSLTITDANGCENINSILIEEPTQGIETTYAIDHVSCFGERDGRIDVNTFGGQAPYEYSLDGNLFTSSEVLVGLDANEYVLSIRDELGCLFTDTVEVVQPLEISLELGEDILLSDGNKTPLLPILANAVPPIAYSWSSEDTTLNCLTCPVPIIENIEQTYRYFLTVTDANNCMITDDIFVRVDKEAVVFVATGFTPNNDDVNDYLYVQANEGVERVVAFEVFDRFGQLVFQSNDTPINDKSFGWNGYFKNDFVSSGVFVWTLIVEFDDGERGAYQGNTTVIR
jgi:gliding motility-associated-like protein